MRSPEFQAPQQPGDAAEQCHHPDIPEREDHRPDRGELRIKARTKGSDVIEIVDIGSLQKEKVHLRYMIRKGMVPSAAVRGPVIIVPAERTISYIADRRHG